MFTALRLDIEAMIIGDEAAPDFDNVEVITPVDPPEEKPIVYGENKMDIDFEALANSTSSSTIKSLHSYVAGLTPSKQNEYTGIFKGKNLIMITAEAFSSEVIDPVMTPTLYRLANKGIKFTDYYQPDWGGSTTGGEYTVVENSRRFTVSALWEYITHMDTLGVRTSPVTYPWWENVARVAQYRCASLMIAEIVLYALALLLCLTWCGIVWKPAGDAIGRGFRAGKEWVEETYNRLTRPKHTSE